MLTTISVLRDPWEAHVLCGRLSAEGVPAVIIHEFHIATAWHLSNALGGIKVQVPSDWCEEAKTIEALAREGAYKAKLAHKFGTLDDLRCPRCGCGEYRKRRPFPIAALAILISGLSGTIVPPTGWICTCSACEKEYRDTVLRRRWMTLALATAIGTLALLAVGVAVWLALHTTAGLVVIVAALITLARWSARHILDAQPDTEASPEES